MAVLTVMRVMGLHGKLLSRLGKEGLGEDWCWLIGLRDGASLASGNVSELNTLEPTAKILIFRVYEYFEG